MVNALLIIIIVVLFSERIAKFIPDSKAGVIGKIRQVFKVISLYTPNVE